ncbi:MAG: serine/threonine protein kinase, partial [Myxococcota bacterium]|nr:serine/threonine protein kinase [Myxococcota bacterium]
MLDGSAVAQLGKYELLRKLATGGMAEVYLARTSGLGGFERLVVVKRILPSLAANRDYVERFLDEARIAATLYHRNIVQVFDVGRAGDDYFLAMEYLEGADLRALTDAVDPHGVPLPHALQVVLGICAGLHYAHERTSSDGRALGIVHRDLTPHNVFVTFDGEVKIIDFGIVKAADRLGATRHSTMKGKLRYMSPEQIRTQPLDRRSDLFALGILLWELTTGRRLYTAESDFELMKQIIETEAPLPSTVCTGYPAELESIVMRALARDVNARFTTAQELHDVLESFAARAGLSTTPAVLGRFMRDRIRISPADPVVAAPAAKPAAAAAAVNVGDLT